MLDQHSVDPDDRPQQDTPQGGSTGERLHERGAGYEPAERERQRPNEGARPRETQDNSDHPGGRDGGNQNERQGNGGGGNQGDR